MVGSTLSKRHPPTLSGQSLATAPGAQVSDEGAVRQPEERADQFVLLVPGGAAADLSQASVVSASVSSGHSEPDNLNTGAQTR